MANNNLDVKLRIDTAVKGLASINDLVKELQSLIGFANKRIPDPTKEIGEGADKSAAAVDSLGRKIKSVDSKPIKDPTKNIQSGAKKSDDALKKLIQSIMGAGKANEFDDIVKSLEELGISAKNLEEIINEFGEGFAEGLEDGIKEAGLASKAVDKLGVDAKGAGQSFGYLGKMVKAAFATVIAFVSFQGLKSLSKDLLNVGAGFEQVMARVRAVTRATDAEFEKLNTVARQMGATTEFTARQAADGLNYLGLAGFNAEKSIASLPGTLNLAAAAGIDLGRAADITTNILTAMRLETDDLARVNDSLVRTFTTANTDVEMLGEAFKYAAPKAAAYGYEVEEILGLLGQLANTGIRGSMAGTQLNFAFSKTSEVFSMFGESAYDATGKTKGLIEAIELLARMKVSPGVVNDIFGERGGRAVNALLGQELANAGNLRRYINDEIRKAFEEDATNTIATIQRDTIETAFKLLRSAVEETYVGAFEGMRDEVITSIRGLTQAVTDATPVLISFGEGLLQIVSYVLQLGTAFLNLASYFNDTATRAVALKTALAVLAVAGFRAVFRILVELGRTTLAARGALLQYNAAQAATAAGATRLAAGAGAAASGFQVVGIRATASAVAVRGFNAAMALFGGPIGLAITALVGVATALSAYDTKIKENRDAIRRSIPELENKVEIVNELANAWDNLNKLEAENGEISASSGRLKWIKQVQEALPELANDIKILGTDFEAITELINNAKFDIFNRQVDNLSANMRETVNEIGELEDKIKDFEDAATKRRNWFGLDKWADKAQAEAEEAKQKIEELRKSLKANLSDQARAYAEEALRTGADINKAIADAQKGITASILGQGAQWAVDPATVQSEVKKFVTEFYESISEAAAGAALPDSSLESLISGQLSRVETMIRQFGDKLSGSQLLDLSQTIGGYESSRTAFLDFITSLETTAQEASYRIQQELKKMVPDTDDYKRAEAAYKDYQNRLVGYAEQREEALREMDAKFYADQLLKWEEQERGEKISAEERIKIYNNYIKEKWAQQDADRKKFEDDQIAAQRAVISMCNNSIAALKALGEAGVIAGGAVAAAVGAAEAARAGAEVSIAEIQKKQAEAQKRSEDQLAAFQKRLAAINAAGSGPKEKTGGSRSGAKSKEEREAEKLAKEEEKKAADRAKREAEEQAAIRTEVLRRQLANDEISVQEFFDKRIAMAKAAAEEEGLSQYASYKQNLDLIADEYDRLQQRLQSANKYTQDLVDAGFLSQSQGQAKIRAEVEKTLPILEEMARQYEQMADEAERLGIIIPGVTEKLLEMKGVNLQNLAVLKQTVNEINASIEDSLSASLASLKDDWRDLNEWAKTFFKSILDGINQIAAQNLAQALLGGINSGGGGVGGLLGGLFGFASGGHVKGPGTGTSDSIMARLSNGEYVLKAKAVRALGVPFLNMLNNVGSPAGLFKNPTTAKFANGGYVSSSLSGLQDQANDPTIMQKLNFEVKNTLDAKGLTTVITSSPEFDKQLKKKVYRDSKSFAQSLGG